jgi:hypothetical protein
MQGCQNSERLYTRRSAVVRLLKGSITLDYRCKGRNRRFRYSCNFTWLRSLWREPAICKIVCERVQLCLDSVNSLQLLPQRCEFTRRPREVRSRRPSEHRVIEPYIPKTRMRAKSASDRRMIPTCPADVCLPPLTSIKEMRGGDPVRGPHHHTSAKQYISAKHHACVRGHRPQLFGEPRRAPSQTGERPSFVDLLIETPQFMLTPLPQRVPA